MVMTRLRQPAWLARLGFGVVVGVASFGIQGAAHAELNLVTNGTFEVTGGSTSFQFGTWGPYAPTETLAGWASTGYNSVFLPGSNAATTFYGTSNLSFWGPAYGVNNGYTGTAPGGGNFLALDADYPAYDQGGHAATAAVTQTINGLTVGTTYLLSFSWAGIQQHGYDGATTEGLTVSLGDSSESTSTINLENHGFSGWMDETFSFVATDSSEVLSFLASGSPAVPPFVLLANVSMTEAPEPASVAVLLTGLASLFGIGQVRRRSRADM